MNNRITLGSIKQGQWFIFHDTLCICTDKAQGLVAYTRVTGTIAHEYAVNPNILAETVPLVTVGIKTGA